VSGFSGKSKQALSNVEEAESQGILQWNTGPQLYCKKQGNLAERVRKDRVKAYQTETGKQIKNKTRKVCLAHSFEGLAC